MDVHTRSAVVDDGSRDKAYVADGVGHLPLGNRNAAVMSWALVDPDVFDSVSRHKWSIVGAGYVGRKVSMQGRQRMIYLHRSVFGLDDIHDPALRFKSGDRLDCRRSNLRPSTAWAVRNLSNRDGGWALALLTHSVCQAAVAS